MGPATRPQTCILAERGERDVDILQGRVHQDYTHLYSILKFFPFDYTYTRNCVWINCKSVIEIVLGDQFSTCKGICISPPPLLDDPPSGITLTLSKFSH